MPNWGCKACGWLVRGREAPPAYCVKCGFTVFQLLPENLGGRTAEAAAPRRGGSAGPPSPSGFSLRLLGPIPDATATPERTPERERRRTPRIRPRRPVEVHVLPDGPLRIVNISGSGVLIEHERPLRFGEIYQAELRHADRRDRLRVQVARSTLVPAGRAAPSPVRYHTAFEFLEPLPPGLFATLADLTQES